MGQRMSGASSGFCRRTRPFTSTSSLRYLYGQGHVETKYLNSLLKVLRLITEDLGALIRLLLEMNNCNVGSAEVNRISDLNLF